MLKVGRLSADEVGVSWMRTAHVRLVDQRGQTMTEYAILLGVIALLVVAVAFLLGGSISSLFSKTATHL
jgi:Flp pilus assembly pilin Flp